MFDLVISDLHIGHKNIEEFCPIRKTKDYNDHDKFIIEYVNNKLSPKDKVLFLGDMAFYNGYKKLINLRTDCIYYLIPGNHDRQEHIQFYRDKLHWNILEGINIIKDGELINEKFLSKYQNCLIYEDKFYSHFPIINNIKWDQKYDKITSLLYTIFKAYKCKYNYHGHTHEINIEDNRCINMSIEQFFKDDLEIPED